MSKLHFGKARKVAKNLQERIKPPPQKKKCFRNKWTTSEVKAKRLAHLTQYCTVSTDSNLQRLFGTA